MKAFHLPKTFGAGRLSDDRKARHRLAALNWPAVTAPPGDSAGCPQR
jgi:hypothetical protein